MANCTKCGFQLDPTKRVSACPRCGASIGADGPGAPPAFAEGRPDTTLFGLPAADEGSLEEPNFGGAPSGSGDPLGPPSIDSGTFGEIDFGAGEDHGLQLDLGTPSGDSGNALDLPAPAPARPPAPPRAPTSPPGDPAAIGLDLPAPASGRSRVPKAPPAPPSSARPPSGVAGLDLPAPAPRAPAAPKAPPGVSGLDLPSPVSSRPQAPKAPPGVSGLDLPSPVSARQAPPKAPPGVSGLDLPVPSGPGGSRPPKAPPGPPRDLPAPVELDLPAAARSRPGAPQLHSDLDLPGLQSSAHDLPTPIGLDLPGVDRLDLPEPKSGLDMQPVDNMVAPANLDLEPSRTGLSPAETGVESRDAGGLAPKGAAAAGAITTDLNERPGYAKPQGPAPRELGAGSGSRKLIYGVAALGLVGAIVGGLYIAGVFDDELPQTSGHRGIAKNDQPKPANEGDKGAAVEAKERAPEVLALLDQDTPSGYAEAAKAAEASGDPVGKAEALLLLHLRYGPALEQAKEGANALQPYVNNDEPFVARVLGLISIVNEQYEPAAAALEGDAPRHAAYRALMKLRQGRPADALPEAEAASILPMGKALAAEAELSTAPAQAYAELKKAAESESMHPSLAALLAEHATERGELATAEMALTKIETEGLPEGFAGRVAALRGNLAAAKGDAASAMKHYDQALASSPEDANVLEAKVRAGIDNNLIAPAVDAMGALRDVSPKSVDVLLLAVELQVAAGKGDEALAALEQLATAAPDRVEVPFHRGEVHAMRLQVDEAQVQFAKVIEQDPTFHRVALSQAAMLDAARKPVEAVAALDAAVARLREVEGHEDAIAELLTTKARYLLDQKQPTAALAALEQALDTAPTHNDAQVLRGLTRMSNGDAEGGKADLLVVYERTGSYPGLVAPLGRLFAAAGQLEQLEGLVGERAEEPSASAEIKVVGARLRLAQGRPEDAKKLLSDAMAAAPNNWQAQMLMAQAVLDGGDPQDALGRIEAVRTPEPKAEVSVLKGKILEHNGKHAEARGEYARATAIDPENIEARFLHGRLLAFAGQAKQALAELEYVTSRTDGYPRAHLNIGRAQRDLGKNDEAIAALGRALELEPTLLEAHYLAGRIHLERNRLGPAVTSLQAASAKEAEAEVWYPEALLFLGRALDKSGKRNAAKSTFETFLEVAPEGHSSRATVERTLEKL